MRVGGVGARSIVSMRVGARGIARVGGMGARGIGRDGS